MPRSVRLKNAIPEPGSLERQRLRSVVLLCALALGLAWSSSSSIFLMGLVASVAQAQPAAPNKAQLRAKIKSAAEELNDIASSAPGMIRSMFAGETASAKLLALDERSIVAQTQLENAIIAANDSGALSADETKELAHLGELAKKTRGPVKEDIETLKSVLAVPVVGGDTAVRLAPKSQQDAVIKNAEAAKLAVGALVAAIRKLP
jgi:hypothetical protein